MPAAAKWGQLSVMSPKATPASMKTRSSCDREHSARGEAGFRDVRALRVRRLQLFSRETAASTVKTSTKVAMDCVWDAEVSPHFAHFD